VNRHSHSFLVVCLRVLLEKSRGIQGKILRLAGMVASRVNAVATGVRLVHHLGLTFGSVGSFSSFHCMHSNVFIPPSPHSQTRHASTPHYIRQRDDITRHQKRNLPRLLRFLPQLHAQIHLFCICLRRQTYICIHSLFQRQQLCTTTCCCCFFFYNSHHGIDIIDTRPNSRHPWSYI
jgi:hypothetical protein